MKRCDLCGKTLPLNRKRFCCNKHKDRYHNENNPRGIYSHLKNRDNDDPHVYEMADAEHGEWDHGDCGIY